MKTRLPRITFILVAIALSLATITSGLYSYAGDAQSGLSASVESATVYVYSDESAQALVQFRVHTNSSLSLEYYVVATNKSVFVEARGIL